MGTRGKEKPKKRHQMRRKNECNLEVNEVRVIGWKESDTTE